MKTISLSIISITTAALISCNNQMGNPYGAPAASQAPAAQGSNPYAVPQLNGETGNYAQNPPYQSLPEVGNTFPQAPAYGGNTYIPPVATAPAVGVTIPHIVKKAIVSGS